MSAPMRGGRFSASYTRAGVINLDVAGFGSWTITEHGRQVLRGKAAVELRKEALVERGDKRPARSQSAAGGSIQALSGADAALFEALKAVRRSIATEKKVPAYVVFPDKTLLDMVHLKPQTRDHMAMVHGVGRGQARTVWRGFSERRYEASFRHASVSSFTVRRHEEHFAPPAFPVSWRGTNSTTH